MYRKVKAVMKPANLFHTIMGEHLSIDDQRCIQLNEESSLPDRWSLVIGGVQTSSVCLCELV